MRSWLELNEWRRVQFNFFRDLSLSLGSLFRVIAQGKAKVKRERVWKMPPSFHLFFLFYIFILLFLPVSVLSFSYASPRLSTCSLSSVVFLSHTPSSPPLSSQEPFLNSRVRSDLFHRPEKANYLPFYDFHYFTTSHSVLLLGCWLPALTHTCTYTTYKQHTHTHTQSATMEHIPICTLWCQGLHNVKLKWGIMTASQINYVWLKSIIFSSSAKGWAVLLSISYIKTALSHE